MQIGVDYFLGNIDEATWFKDSELMAQTGVKIVRLCGISWNMLEPFDNQFNLEWLDKLIAIFAQRGLSIIFVTPTWSIPLWLYEKCPEIIQVNHNGIRRNIGENGNRCLNSPALVEHVKRLMKVLAERYAPCPSISAWQIDDKLNVFACSCENCKKAFRAWLSDKYDTLENVNTAFESQYMYTDWNLISAPSSISSPTLKLEYNRFCEDSINNFVNMQVDIIRSYNSKAYVAINTILDDKSPNYSKISSSFSMSLFDSEPLADSADDENSKESQAFALDMMRCLHHKRFWVANTNRTKAENGNIPTKAFAPNMISGFAMQALAHGADTIINFMWRSPLTTAQMFTQSIIDHSNIPSRKFNEFAELCANAGKFSCIYKTKIISDIAIVYSHDSDIALKMQPQSCGFDYLKQLKMYYSAFARLGANIDVVDECADLSDYKIVVAPSIFVNNTPAVENLYRFVVGGGTLLLTCRSGVKNNNNNCIAQPLPTVFTELTGITVAECSSIGNTQQTITDYHPREYKYSQWADVIKLDTATAFATYSDGCFAGETAVSLNEYCNGKVYYVGVVPEKKFCSDIANSLMKRCGIPRLKGMPEGIEITTRTNDVEDFVFFFNNSPETVEINLPTPLPSVIDSVEKDVLTLPPYTCDIVRR